MPEIVGFQTLVILDPYGIIFDAMGVFGQDFMTPQKIQFTKIDSMQKLLIF